MPPANKIDKTKRTPPRKKASAKKHRRRKRPVPYRIAFLRWHNPDQVQGSGAGPSRLRRAPLEFYPYSVCFCRENDSTNPRGCQCGAKGAGGKPQAPCFGNLCRGRFYIGPVCGGANARGRDKSRPYGRRRVCSQPGKPWPRVITNLCRGRCSHRPGDPAAPQTSAGGINPSPTNHGKRPAKRDGHNPPGGRRAGCPHPAGPAPPQTPAGGINPSPTNHGKRPAKRDSHTPPGGRRAECPHPAGPRPAANPRGRIWNPPLQWVPRIGNMRCSRLARNTQNDCRAGCPHPAGPAARRPVHRPPRCALPVSPPISSPACHLSRRAV